MSTTPSPQADIRSSKVIRLRTSPSFLPEKYRNRSERLTVSFTPSAGERHLFRCKKDVPPSQWAPKNRTVTYGPLKGSKWDYNFMPHMNGIMDASFFPSVREIGNIKAPQTGSSAGMETCIAYAADMKPADALIVYPDRDTGRKRFTDYLIPVFEKSPPLRKLLTGLDDDLSAMRIKLKAMLIYLGWSGSDTTLGNVSAKYLGGDEIDKWKRKKSSQEKGVKNRKEADPIKLFLERFGSFLYGAKCWLVSTPTDVDGPIWKFYNEAQLRFDYHIFCPECGEHHLMSDKYIDFGGTRDPKAIEEQDLARYIFPCCGLVANDRVRGKALESGEWFEKLSEQEIKDGVQPRGMWKALKEDRPEKICFHSPGWVSKLVKNSKIAAAFLRGLADPAEMHYYDNQIKAVAHVPYRQNRKQDVLKKLKDDRPERLVPGGNKVAALVAGVDTQKDNFVFTIRAYGWGETQESWLVRHGEVDTFAALDTVLFDTEYKDSSGLYYPVHCAVIDTGGDKTADVYDYVRTNPGRLVAYKGASGRKSKPKSKTIIDTYPGTNIQIPGGVTLWICDTHYYKDALARKLRIKGDAPGAYHFHSTTGDDLIDEYCAEYVDDRRLWQCPKNKPNHYWDCGVMDSIGADMLQLKWLKDPNGGTTEETNEDTSEETGEGKKNAEDVEGDT